MYKVLSDQEKEDRGQRAKELLNSDVFFEAIKDLQACLHGQLDHISTDDSEVVMQIIRQIRAIKNVPTKLEAWVHEAKMIRVARGGKVD